MGVIRHNTWLVYQTRKPRATSRAKVTEHVKYQVAQELGAKSGEPLARSLAAAPGAGYA